MNSNDLCRTFVEWGDFNLHTFFFPFFFLEIISFFFVTYYVDIKEVRSMRDIATRYLR